MYKLRTPSIKISKKFNFNYVISDKLSNIKKI